VPAIVHTTYVAIVLWAPKSAGYEGNSLQCYTGSVSKFHYPTLHLRGVTITIPVAFAGKFFFREVPDGIPPITVSGIEFFGDFCAGFHTSNPIGNQAVFCLPMNGGSLRFQSCKAIYRDFTVCDNLLYVFDQLFGFFNCFWTEAAVSFQFIVLLKVAGCGFGS